MVVSVPLADRTEGTFDGWLRACNVTKSFPSSGRPGATPVLNGVDLHIGPSEFVAIVGPSGSGKSTLLHCLAGLEPVTSGSISALDRNLSALRGNTLARFRRDHIGFVFQSYNLIPSLTAIENVSLPGQLARRRHAARTARQSLDAVGISEHAGSLPHTLSGGQQQRVAIARAIASGAELVFADEPTGALDSVAGERILRLLRNLVGSGNRTVIMVTHDLDAASRADRVIVLRDGLVRAQLERPTPDAILACMAGGPGGDMSEGAFR